ncbi:hypothetical protein LJR219_001641 [Phenylobacterium sp. LjRoot219]|uniref:hypothetical protein n=1 Tax=Phenylobacterium sp. LjRoot219 TaxID=3342283 RepID=UPI003ECD7DF1
MRPTAGIVVAALACTALGAPAGALAQPAPGEITFYADIGFKGQSRSVNEARNVLTIPFVVRSARITGRGTWEACSRANFRGPCNTVSTDQGNIRWTVASARPVAPQVQPPRPPAAGASLRGMAAEFFPAPAERGGRVASCASGAAACAADSARRFCASRGWRGAAHYAQETVNRINYLADVLCTRTSH